MGDLSKGFRGVGDTEDLPSALARLEGTRAAFGALSKAERMRSVAELEEFFFELVRLVNPSLFVEAGAKDAGASRKVSTLLTGAAIVAFEANPYTFRRFKKKYDYRASGIQYRNQALASRVGSVSFNLRKSDDGRPAADGQGSLLKFTEYAPGHIQVTVPCTTLDTVMDEFGPASEGCVLWVDVEGATEEVMGGATRTLSTASVIFIEVEDKEYWGAQWLAERVLSHLHAAGLHPVARDFQSRAQYNVLCVRNSLLAQNACEEAIAAYRQRILPAVVPPRSS